MPAFCCKCGDDFPSARAALGYRTCLSCGQEEAKLTKFTVIPAYSKGAYQVISKHDIANTNPKR